MGAPSPAKKAAAPRKATTAQKRTPARAAAVTGEQKVAALATVKPEEPFDGFDLDALDKKSVLPNVTEVPFRFLLDGQRYTMMDPRDVDWKDVLDGISNPIMFMRLAMDDPEAADRFISVKLAGWKLSALFDNWQKHFGVEGMADLNQLLSGRAGPRAAG